MSIIRNIMAVVLLLPVWAGLVEAGDAASMPSLKLAEGATGTLKICSKPLACDVVFMGRRISKDHAVLSMNDVKAGLYEVIFEKNGARLVKKARVMPGETTIIFGSLDSPEVVRIVDEDPLKGVSLASSGASSAEYSLENAPLSQAKPASVAGQNTYVSAAGRNNDHTFASTRMYNDSAEVMFELAEILRHAVNPLKARARYARALELYRKIIRDYPSSPRVEASHYSSGRIYESIYVRDYESAVKEYKQILAKNPYTRTDAAQRVAELYNDSKDLKAQAQPQLANIPDTTSATEITTQSGSGAYGGVGSGIAPITELTVESIKTVDAAGSNLAR